MAFKKKLIIKSFTDARHGSTLLITALVRQRKNAGLWEFKASLA